MKIVITGGLGFIGSNFVRYFKNKYSDIEICVIDKITYAGKEENLSDILDTITLIRGDICDETTINEAFDDCDQVINFAAESHVDQSIFDSSKFILTNVEGTRNILENARKKDIDRVIQISTDEVYGSINSGSFQENDLLNPSSPYSASKAAADLLVGAYYKTYGLPVLITRSTNNYGPFQHNEKMIPTMITRALKNLPLPIYGNGENVRDWTYVEDNCAAIDLVRESGSIGEIYNIGSHEEYRNIEIVQMILKITNKPESLIHYVPDRLGHDHRYSVHTDKIDKLGWKPKTSFKVGLKNTIQWYIDNTEYWN